MSSVFDLQLFASVAVTLLVIMDPPGAVPVFLALTRSMTHKQRVVAARRASLVALGTPLLAGPGAIVATMLAVRRAEGVAGYLAVAVALLAAIVVVWLSLRFAGQLHRLLRDSGTMLVTRIAGLLLSAIAVQMVADSVRAFVTTAS